MDVPLSFRRLTIFLLGSHVLLGVLGWKEGIPCACSCTVRLSVLLTKPIVLSPVPDTMKGHHCHQLLASKNTQHYFGDLMVFKPHCEKKKHINSAQRQIHLISFSSFYLLRLILSSACAMWRFGRQAVSRGLGQSQWFRLCPMIGRWCESLWRMNATMLVSGILASTSNGVASSTWEVKNMACKMISISAKGRVAVPLCISLLLIWSRFETQSICWRRCWKTFRCLVMLSNNFQVSLMQMAMEMMIKI